MNELLIINEYRDRLRTLRCSLEELEEKKTSIKSCLSGTGGTKQPGRSGAYFEYVVEKYEEVYSEFIDTTINYINTKNQLFRKIERLKDERYRNILYYRYVCGHTVMATMKECGYVGESRFYKLLKSAKAEYERVYGDGTNTIYSSRNEDV